MAGKDHFNSAKPALVAPVLQHRHEGFLKYLGKLKCLCITSEIVRTMLRYNGESTQERKVESRLLTVSFE